MSSKKANLQLSPDLSKLKSNNVNHQSIMKYLVAGKVGGGDNNIINCSGTDRVETDKTYKMTDKEKRPRILVTSHQFP